MLIHGEKIDTKTVVFCIEKAFDDVDTLANRIAIKRYVNGEYWKVTAEDEHISKTTYYRCIDDVIMCTCLHLVAAKIIKI